MRSIAASPLAAVSAETMKLKTSDQAYGAASLVRLSAGTPVTLVSMASRLAAGARPMVFQNVGEIHQWTPATNVS